MLECELDCSNQESQFVARVVTRSVQTYGVERPALEKRTHGISDLNLSDGAGTGFFKFTKDVRREHIPSDDCQIRRCFSKRWLLNHVFDLINAVFYFLAI